MRKFIVRDVVDMDVALHGRRFIVVEFALMVAFGLGLTSLELFLGLFRGQVVPYQLVTGICVGFVTINCLTFLLLALRARQRIDAPMPMKSVLWLTALAVLLLLVPLAFPLLAVGQAARSSSSLAGGLR